MLVLKPKLIAIVAVVNQNFNHLIVHHGSNWITNMSKNDCTIAKGATRPGKPKTVTPAETVGKVYRKVFEDCRL